MPPAGTLPPRRKWLPFIAPLRYRNPTEHKIRLGQVAKWAQHTVKEGPAGITKRQRVRVLLGQSG
jgi:hypothetical protein